MGQILIRKIDDGVLAKLKARAKANARSTEAEVRSILTEAIVTEVGDHVPVSSLIGAAASGRRQEEIVDYVRALRDEWERER